MKQCDLKLTIIFLIAALILLARPCELCAQEVLKGDYEIKLVKQGHPRLYFDNSRLKELRALQNQPNYHEMYVRIMEDADWCMQKPLRQSWIAPVSVDPNYENLYDRFYGMMHDMAVLEHVSFAYAYSGDRKYFDCARKWLLACSNIWKKEGEGEPDQSKAYAALRILKGLSVSYDLLYNDLSEADRSSVSAVISHIGQSYYKWYNCDPNLASSGQNAHHGSVEIASFGIAALTMLGENKDANDWVKLAIKKHVDFCLPFALTSDGSHNQATGYWASTMQYRLMFMDALRNVTGIDLFKPFAKQMDGTVACAVIVGKMDKAMSFRDNSSVLWCASYTQLNYWSPVLMYLAREYRRPTYQYLALWDLTTGSLQRTRYITRHGEALLFSFGGYEYAWYDSTVKAKEEPGLPLDFVYDQANEAYMRNSYKPGDLAVGVRRGRLLINKDEGPLLCEIFSDMQPVATPVNIKTSSNKSATTMVFDANVCQAFSYQSVEFERPDTILITRKTANPIEFWSYKTPKCDGNMLKWKTGEKLQVLRGGIQSFDPNGFVDKVAVGMGKLPIPDPYPGRYAKIKITADNENIMEFRITR